MPYSNTWEEEGLFRKFSGIVTGDEILRSNLDLHVDPHFENIRYIINDFSGIDRHEVKGIHTSVYAKTDDMVAFVKGRMKIAIVATEEPVISLARSYKEQIEGSHFQCEIFSSLADARAWVAANP